MKKIVTVLSAILLTFGVFQCTIVAAQETSDELNLSEADKVKAIEEAEKKKTEDFQNGVDSKTLALQKENKARSAASPYWASPTPGQKYFYDANGSMFGNSTASKVIDVSKHNKAIDWNAVKNAGEVDGVIVRLGYGSNESQFDDYAQRNISELNRLGIPYGVYLYSYAANGSEAAGEAQFFINLIKKFNAKPTYPIYYDLENWSYRAGGVTYKAPTSVATYESIVSSFMSTMNANGYNADIYSYRSYFQGVLNSPNILKYASWIAAYTNTLGYTNNYYSGPIYGWQYTSDGGVAGINGRVDMNAFTNFGKANYQTHVSDLGWLPTASEGSVAGTTGKSKKMEAIRLSLGKDVAGSISYQTHIQDLGWGAWASNGAISGTTGKAKRLEAIKIKLDGEAANLYDVYYRTHVQEFGWTGWAKNGETSGSSGYGYRMEAVQVKFVEKNGAAPGSRSNAYYVPKVRYFTHIQDYGNTNPVTDGSLSGTTGKLKRMEAIYLDVNSLREATGIDGGIVYSSHVQDIGWMNEVYNGGMSGTSARLKRLEAVKINLYGNLVANYDIYYRTHMQDFGWSGWAANGAACGSEGYSKRLEAVQVVIVSKGASAPGSTSKVFYKK